MSVESLQQNFPHEQIRFYQRDQLVMIELKNDYGQATLTTHGATLLSYIPAGSDEILWVSQTAVFDGSKPVRGGVPVCWPWFGAYDVTKMPAHPSDAAKKAHGFVRYEVWQVEAVESVGEAVRVVLSLTPNDNTQAVWPFDFKVRLAVTLGEALTVDLIGENRSDQAWWLTEALHSYFKVAQAPGLVIEGLENTRYFDKNRDFAEFKQIDTLNLQPPMDCVFINHSWPITLKDQGRDIRIDKQHSASTIVWNPGEEGVKAFADIPTQDYANFVCVEAGNALENGYWLKPGESHSMSMVLSQL